MTISKELSAPLIVMVGARGTQGGSVVNNLEASDKPYRMRGLTRDAQKPSAIALAKKGVDVVSCAISVGNEARVQKAFEGATYVFVGILGNDIVPKMRLARSPQAVTNYWEHADKAREVADGKLMVDAARAVDVKLFILSSEPSVTKISSGKLTGVLPFDPKAEVSEYARHTGTPVVDVHVGGYMNNFATPFAKPGPAGDGSYVIAARWRPESRMPLIDTFHDTGLFVHLAIEPDEFSKGDGKVIAAYGEWVTVADQIEILSQVSDRKVIYVQLTQ